MRPTHFIAIHIEDKLCVNSIKKCQDEISKLDKSFKGLMIQPEKLHFTLSLITLPEWENKDSWVVKTVESFKSAVKNISLETNFMSNVIHLRGMGHFNNKGDDKTNLLLKELNEKLNNYLKLSGLIVDENLPFNPHVTIAKATKYKKGFISEKIVKSYNGYFFGSHPITRLSLCSMLDPPRDDKFYHTLHEYGLH